MEIVSENIRSFWKDFHDTEEVIKEIKSSQELWDEVVGGYIDNHEHGNITIPNAELKDELLKPIFDSIKDVMAIFELDEPRVVAVSSMQEGYMSRYYETLMYHFKFNNNEVLYTWWDSKYDCLVGTDLNPYYERYVDVSSLTIPNYADHFMYKEV